MHIDSRGGWVRNRFALERNRDHLWCVRHQDREPAADGWPSDRFRSGCLVVAQTSRDRQTCPGSDVAQLHPRRKTIPDLIEGIEQMNLGHEDAYREAFANAVRFLRDTEEEVKHPGPGHELGSTAEEGQELRAGGDGPTQTGPST